jgi:hypothetical protein
MSARCERPFVYSKSRTAASVAVTPQIQRFAVSRRQSGARKQNWLFAGDGGGTNLECRKSKKRY